MISKKVNKNILPLLAITALMLSVSLANYTQVLDSKVLNTQSVLSESDEKNDDNEDKEENERFEIKEVEKDIDYDDNDDNDDEIDNKDDDKDDEIETEFEEESETASVDGTVNKFKLKIKTKTVGGKTMVETAAGEIEVKDKPEDTINDLVKDNVLDTPTSFEAKTDSKNKLEFEIEGVETKKFLGLFTVNLPKIVTVDATTGEVTSSNQSIWTRFLSFLSK